MWNLFCSVIIVFELLLLSWFIIEKIRKSKLTDTILFIGFVFTVNFTVHLLATVYKYSFTDCNENMIIEIIGGIGSAVKMFVGEVNEGALSKIANDYPIFMVVYVLGICLALISTINTIFEAIDHTIRNSIRLSKAMKADVCDIVVGNSTNALKYARESGAVILLDVNVSKDIVNNLIEDGYAVLHKSFTPKLLGSRIFRKTTRYNIICPESENSLEFINTIINYIILDFENRNLHLFVEIEGDKAETVRREFIGKGLLNAINQSRLSFLMKNQQLLIKTICNSIENDVFNNLGNDINSCTNILKNLRESLISLLKESTEKNIADICETKTDISKATVLCYEDDFLNTYLDTICTDISSPKLIDAIKNAINSTAKTKLCEIIDNYLTIPSIDTFSTHELLARTFTEENPVSKYLPDEFFTNGALKPESDIAVFIVGYGKLGHELYKHSILNNQYVTYTDEYKVLPLHYYLCDKNIDTSEWLITGLNESLVELNDYADDYFPIPELPYKTDVISANTSSREVINAIRNHVRKPDSYAFIIIDSENDYSNIEISAKIQTLLHGNNNYHIAVRCEDASVVDDEYITYFGKNENVFNHEVIVNDVFSSMGVKLNEMYLAHYASDEDKKRTDFAKYIQQLGTMSWLGLDHFTKYSNIYSAMNLRVKLNLLGFDYLNDGKGENISLVKRYIKYDGNQNYESNFTPSIRNALIAQEHARWNAYHLINEWMPLKKDDITEKSRDNAVKFIVKFPEIKKHACITTHLGLHDLSSYLSNKANNGSLPSKYDYYTNDEFLIAGVEEMLGSFRYSITKR